MSFSFHENMEIPNNQYLVTNNTNEKSVKKQNNDYDNLILINKSSKNILKKPENKNSLEKMNFRTCEYDSENIGTEYFNRKSQFDLFRYKIGGANNPNYNKCQNYKFSVYEKRNFNENYIIKTSSSIKSQNNNNIALRGSKFSIFESNGISHKTKLKDGKNHEKSNIMVNNIIFNLY
jgi:hypothetical protein